MRAIHGWWVPVVIVALAVLPWSTGCCASDGGAAPSPSGQAASAVVPDQSQAVHDPQPPPPLQAGDTIPPAEAFVKVKASTYGPSGGGVFLVVDVADPDAGAPYTDEGLVNVWVGTGDDATSAPSTAPTGTPPLSSQTIFDLNNRSWGGGLVVDRPTGHTKMWVFVEVQLERNGMGPQDRWFNKVLPITSVDLPTGWVTATVL